MWDDPSYATMVADGPGCIADRAECLNKAKYESIEVLMHFMPLVWRPLAYFGRRQILFSTNWLLQKKKRKKS